jgi:hypothetical protein
MASSFPVVWTGLRVLHFGCAEHGSCSSYCTVWHFDGLFFIDYFYYPSIPAHHYALLRENHGTGGLYGLGPLLENLSKFLSS